MRSNQLQFFAILIIIACGCTFTQTYTPSFNKSAVAVVDSIKTKYGFEDVRFTAKKMSGANGKHTSLTVKFINGKNLPADTTQTMMLLGKQIKGILKNAKEFDTYIISLDKVTVKGDETTDQYTSDEFKSDDLK